MRTHCGGGDIEQTHTDGTYWTRIDDQAPLHVARGKTRKEV